MIHSNQKTQSFQTRSKSIILCRGHIEISEADKTVQVISDLEQIRIQTKNGTQEVTKYVTFDDFCNHMASI